MKIFEKIGLVVFVLLVVSNMVFYRSCSNYKEKYKDLKQAQKELSLKYDSILKLPPDTIKLPPITIKNDSLIYITKKIKEPTIEAKMYVDSLVNDSIDIRLQIWAKDLFKINYKFKPIIQIQKQIIERKIPYKVLVTKEIKVPQRGLWFNAGLGFTDEDIGAKFGLSYLTRKKTSYNLDLVRLNGRNIIFGGVGIKL